MRWTEVGPFTRVFQTPRGRGGRPKCGSCSELIRGGDWCIQLAGGSHICEMHLSCFRNIAKDLDTKLVLAALEG